MREKVPPIMSYATNNKIDIILIQETWIRKCDSFIINKIKEYGFSVKTERKSLGLEWGGGVAFIYREGLNVNYVKSCTKFETFEHVTCKVLTEEGPLFIVSLYRRGYSVTNKFTVEQFCVEFTELLQDLNYTVNPIMIAGDLNVHLELLESVIMNPSYYLSSKISDATKLLELLDTLNMKQWISGATHDLGGTLDLVITSKSSVTVNTVVTGLKNEVCRSDHYHNFIEISCKPLEVSKKVTLQRRDLTCLKSPQFSEKIVCLNLFEKIQSSDINISVGTYIQCLSDVFDESCPTKLVTVTSHRKQRWFNEELREMKRLVRRAERKYRKHVNDTNRNELENVRLYKNCCNQNRSKFICDRIDESEDDLGSIYRTINYYLNDDYRKYLPSRTDDLALANEFADFFINKIQVIRNCIEGDRTPAVIRHSTNTQFNFSSFKFLSQDDVLKLINQMNSKSNSSDPLPVKYIKDKENISQFLPSFQYIINQSLQSGVFPEDLKHGIISPLLKSPDDDVEIHNNFRPVTTLPFLSKLLEKSVSTQLVSYLEQAGLIPQFQSAYLKGHSCETALLKLHSDIQKMLSNNQIVILLKLDLSAAFDTVDHSLLLQILHHKYGLDGTVLKWITSYLSGRSFSVKIGYVNGKKVLLIYGVPQGSVLGPLLFILYVSDLPTVVSNFENMQFQSYADDSHIYIGFNPLFNYSDTMSKVKSCISEVENWMSSMYLKMNVGKTEVLYIANIKDHSVFKDLSITIGKKCYISSAEKSMLSLGVTIDGTMSEKRIISDLVKGCNFNLKKLSHLRYIIPTKHKLLLILSFVLNKLDYCSILLASANVTQIHRLQMVINKAIRFVYCLKKRDHVTSYLKDSHILPMKYRIMFKCCVFVFNILHGTCPDYLRDIIQRKPLQQRSLRSNNDNLLFTTSLHQKTVYNSMVINWNALPFSLRSITSIELFKSNLKTYYFNIAYNT